ncbi:methyltransferase domain-containing protein [Sediminibacterium goheungense]|uniref:Thiopurine S-methyltransferase n=1 Tax=Sediminibacterium goheungense TaxID=1086393 RepID=A0A4V3C3W2_9BACT|nr:methyltransferase domain-containing protein [Sediminibacterium goheungense]TDO23638.1 thiopurine S-methyltransferase [Sediminibacterium goheungense]
MNTFLSADYWNERYKKEETGWDIGYVSTPLKTYIDQLTGKDIRILIPGGGNSYEAAYLLEKGFSNITVIDIAPVVAERLNTQFRDYGNRIQVICGDFFALTGSYNLILEQTFFCAIDPSLREAYAEKMQQLLNPGGKLVGLLFNRSFDNNPPFGGDEKEYSNLFTPFFQIQIMEPSYNSIPQRAGSELFVILQKDKENV